MQRGVVGRVMILNEEFAVDLGCCLHWGRPAVTCLRPATRAFQLKIRWANVQSCFVRVK